MKSLFAQADAALVARSELAAKDAPADTGPHHIYNEAEHIESADSISDWAQHQDWSKE